MNNLNIYTACVPDRMHHIDLGLFKYMIEYTCKMLIQEVKKDVITTLDKRIALIPRFSQLITFPQGLGTLKLFTANHYRNLMKIIIFAIDNLHLTKNKNLINLYLKFNTMYQISRLDEFSESDLQL